MTRNRLQEIITEELTKSDIDSLIHRNLSSSDFEKKVREIAADIVNDLFKTLYQNNSIWQRSVKK